jgi:pimeloyl-ACP methyl ester carboxylesterase
MLKQVTTGGLSIGYVEYGKPDDRCVVLLHGFPYDVRSYADVGMLLAARGYNAIVPFLRGFGTTRLLSKSAMKSGQQAALGHDLIALLDGLDIRKATLAGYDWGGRAACIAAALWPDRVHGLVTGGGYSIQKIDESLRPETPEAEQRYWYQYYFHGERGRAGLQTYRKELCRLLWEQWSPNWKFSDEVYQRSAAAFENEDFVEIVIHSYRHRFGLADGDPELEEMEKKLAESPEIRVPSIAVEGGADGVTPAGSYSALDHHFRAGLQRYVIPEAGHNIPQEAPKEFVDAILAITEGH